MHLSGTDILALVLFAHAWHGRIQANPKVLSVIGWVVNGLAALVLLLSAIRG